MLGYLFKKIGLLVLFAAAMVLIPFALPYALLVVLIGASFKAFAESGSHIDPKAVLFYFAGGVLLFFGSFGVVAKFAAQVYTPFAMTLIVSIITVYAGTVCRPYVIEERRHCRMDPLVERLTAPHPYLLVFAGILRIASLLLTRFAEAQVAPYAGLLRAGETLGNVFFVAAIAMYIVRTVYIFIKNR